jgi:nitrogen regulatory protein PII
MRLVTAVLGPHGWQGVRAARHDLAPVPRSRLEVVVEDRDADDVVGILVQAAR